MELENATEKRPWRQTLAAIISAIVHPVAFPLLTLVVIAYTQTNSAHIALNILLLAVGLAAAPVAALVAYQVARGRWSDLDVSVRQQRYALYPIGLVCALLMCGAFALERAPRGDLTAALALMLANAVDGLINFVYKVSAHTTAAACCAALLWLLAPAWGPPAILATLLVGWSRVELGRHTTGQVLLGWLVGVSSALAVQALFLSSILSYPS